MTEILPFKDTIISADVEADGPIPGSNSMISFASTAFWVTDKGPQVIDTFSINLKELPDAIADPKTMEWWKEHPQAWKLNRENQQEPQAAMVKYHKWLKKHGSIAFASWPVTYDFMFLYWYLMKFVGSSPFLYSGPDIKTYAMAMQKFPSWTEFGEHCVPDEWKAINQAQIDKYCPPELQIEHTPLLDCIKEGFQFCNMLIKNLDEKEKES